jgi:SAM-dependent methyltransferase
MGIEAYSWHFTELANKNNYKGKFDVICLFQVLEHLDNLDVTFKTFNTIAAPGAQLFIGVPNSKKIKFNEIKGALLDIPPNHIGRYNKKNFQLLGNKYGWDISEIQIEPYTSMDVMKTVMFSQSLKRVELPPVKETMWNNIKLHLSIKYMRLQAFFMHKQLGDTLWVHYKKQAK